jgi:hypothetical protein
MRSAEVQRSDRSGTHLQREILMAVAQVAEVTPAIVTPETPTPEQDDAVIGTRPIRPDGVDKVIGRAI